MYLKIFAKWEYIGRGLCFLLSSLLSLPLLLVYKLYGEGDVITVGRGRDPKQTKAKRRGPLTLYSLLGTAGQMSEQDFFIT
jgi:hypothetical protein